MTEFEFTGRSLLACLSTAHKKWRSFHILSLSVKKSMLTMVSVASVGVQGQEWFILFVKHLALGWQGTTDFQEPVARAAALHHALQAASRPIFICTSWDHYSNFLDDVLTGISVLAWRFLAKGRCQPKKQQQQLTITKKGFWL